MNCPKCGKILEPGAVICPNCGETVVENIADDNTGSLKRSVVSEDVLRNFSDPESNKNEDHSVSFSDTEKEQSEDDENQYFNPDDYKNDDDYQSSYSAFDDDKENDDDSDVSNDSDERKDLYEDDYSPMAVEDYDVFKDDDDDDTYDDDDDNGDEDEDDDEEDEDYDSVIVDNNYQDNTNTKRTRIVLIAILILAMLVVVCGVVYLVFGEKLGIVSSTDESAQSTFETAESQSSEAFMFQVPDLYQMKYSDAVTRAKEYGLETKIVYQNSDTIAKGLVMGQSPSAGTTGRVGDTITITVSLGKDGEATSDTTESTTSPTESTTSGGSTTTTTEPTETPTQRPTQAPTQAPTEAPTQPPTQAPTEPPTEAPTNPPTPENNYYILPDSATRLLTTSDISGLSMSELELARNEIYARHGRRFDTGYIQEYFNSQQWYNGTIDPDDFDYDVLSDIELANVWFIYNYEHSN